MITRWALLPVLLAAQVTCAKAQTAQQAELVYRFVPGKVTYEQTRVIGELHVLSGSLRIPVAIDLATILTRRIDAVSPAGEGAVTISPQSTAARVVLPDQEILSLQDREGMTTLLNGEPQTTAGRPLEPITIKIGRGGQISAAPSISSDISSKLLSATSMATLTLPARSAAIGERWSGSTRISFPQDVFGNVAFDLSAFAVSTESELRSLQQEQGRLVATIVTATEGSADDGSGRQHVSIISRFDMTAGELIDSDGEVSLDLRVPDPTAQPPTRSEGRLVGRIHFTTTVLLSRMAQVPSTATQATAALPQPEATVTPPVAPVSLGASNDGWSLGGGEILRYYGSPSEQACRDDCQRDLACQGYTWVKPGGYKAGDPPVCYLMRSVQTASRNRCCVTATRGPFPGR